MSETSNVEREAPDDVRPPASASLTERLLELVGLAWLLLVGGAYAALATMWAADPERNVRPSPLETLDAPALGLLAAVLAAGTISWLIRRRGAANDE